MLDHLEELSQNILSVIEDVVAEQKWNVLILLLIPLGIGASAVAGHLMGSYALARIAKKQGASRKMTLLCWIPFLRYFAIGKLSERCDARRGKQGGPWSKNAAYVGMPVMLVAGLLFWATLLLFFIVVITLSLLILMETIDLGNDALATVVRVIAFAVVAVVYVAAMLMSEYSYLLIIVPILVTVLCGVLSAVIGAVGLAISYVCYAKILREYFRTPTLGVLMAVSAVLGLFPITLLVASFREPLPAVAYDV